MAIRYTKNEERVNTLSHAAGILLGLVVGACFLRTAWAAGSVWAVVGVVLYMFGMLGSYVASTVYHAWPAGSALKERLRKWDHAAIYWHIAGSYSPLTLVALRDQGAWGWGIFAFIWLCAIVGTCVSLRRLCEHSHIETVCYVAMGLTILVAFKPLLEATSPAVVGWIVGEGVSYITGALFYSLYRRPYMHSLFHFFVLGGTICHMMAVWLVLQML